MRKSVVRTVAMAAAALLAVGAAWAEGPTRVLEVNQAPVIRDVGAPEDVFLNQAPNQSNGIFSDATCDFCGNPQILADDFQVISGGMGIDVDTISVWGGYFPGNVPTAAPFEVVIFPDVGGLPGAPVCTQIAAPTSAVTTGVVLFGVDEYQVTIDLASDCILSDGYYFIQINTDTGAGTDDWFWEIGNDDPTFGRIGSLFSFEYPPVTWSVDATNSFATQINGTIVPVELQSISVE